MTRDAESVSRRRILKALTGGTLLAAAGATPGTAARWTSDDDTLAIDGGTPVRETPLGAGLYGPQFFDDEERRELQDVLDARSPFRWWGSGPRPPQKVLAFETEFAKAMGVQHAVGVTSGTTALIAAMAALEVGPGDEVILPAWTWYADYDAIVLSGALPVFAEIDSSFNLDPEDLEKKITPRTKAVLAIHLQGTPCDLDPILELSRKHKFRVLEDCAQCVGGEYRGRPVGSHGDIGIYSFQVNKTITAGEGGAVVTNDPLLFERAVRFHDVGVVRSPYRERIGGGLLARFTSANFRMSEFTGAVLCAQLRKLDRIRSGLRRAAQSVREGIADLPGLRLRKSPDPEGDLGVGVFLDLGTSDRKSRFIAAMRAENVAASGPSGSAILPLDPYIRQKATVHPDWPSFRDPRGKAIEYGPETCPRTIDILGRHAGVVMDPTFGDDDVRDIVRAVRKVFRGLA